MTAHIEGRQSHSLKKIREGVDTLMPKWKLVTEFTFDSAHYIKDYDGSCGRMHGHDLNPLTSSLRAAGLRVHLETSGAYPFSGCFDWVTLSPKTTKPPHESVYPHVSELKVVVVNSRDLEWAQQQTAKVPTSALKYLQPEWNTHVASQSLIVEYVKGHPEWRLSLQTHKFLGVR